MRPSASDSGAHMPSLGRVYANGRYNVLRPAGRDDDRFVEGAIGGSEDGPFLPPCDGYNSGTRPPSSAGRVLEDGQEASQPRPSGCASAEWLASTTSVPVCLRAPQPGPTRVRVCHAAVVPSRASPERDPKAVHA
jgi:hypothetical protein